jgi:hypothetical protein
MPSKRLILTADHRVTVNNTRHITRGRRDSRPPWAHKILIGRAGRQKGICRALSAFFQLKPVDTGIQVEGRRCVTMKRAARSLRGAATG